MNTLFKSAIIVALGTSVVVAQDVLSADASTGHNHTVEVERKGDLVTLTVDKDRLEQPRRRRRSVLDDTIPPPPQGTPPEWRGAPHPLKRTFFKHFQKNHLPSGLL